MLARALGARELNGAACLDIPVRKDFGAPIKVCAASSSRATLGLSSPMHTHLPPFVRM